MTSSEHRQPCLCNWGVQNSTHTHTHRKRKKERERERERERVQFPSLLGTLQRPISVSWIFILTVITKTITTSCLTPNLTVNHVFSLKCNGLHYEDLCWQNLNIWWFVPYLWHSQITFNPRVTEWLHSAGDHAQHITLCWVTNQCIIQLRPIKLYNSNGSIIMWPMLVARQPVLLTNAWGMISSSPDRSTDNSVNSLQ